MLQNYKLTARLSDSFVGSSIDESYYFDIPLPSYSIVNTRVGLSGDKWYRF